MVVVSILLHVKFGSNDHREDAKIVKPPSCACESHGSKLRQGEELLNDNKEIITDIKNHHHHELLLLIKNCITMMKSHHVDEWLSV